MERLELACGAAGAAALRGGWRLALAESCTGGLMAAGLTAIPGASRWFSLGVVCYADAAKTNTLGVPAAVLAEKGAVSEETAAYLCRGALALLAKDDSLGGSPLLAIAVTGIAGPGGGSVEKPLGTVCFGWQKQSERAGGSAVSESPSPTLPPQAGGRELVTETILFSGDRREIRLQSAAYALEKAAEMMSAGEQPSR